MGVFLDRIPILTGRRKQIAKTKSNSPVTGIIFGKVVAIPPKAMSQLRLFLFGPFHATLDRQAAIDFEYDKVRALLAYLAMEADRPRSREALAGLLWPDQPEQTSRNNLRQALSKLRQAIGDQAADPPFLQISSQAVQFNRASDHWLDVTAFSTALAACGKHAHRRAQTCKSCAQRKAQAVELYRGDFLDQFSLRDSTIFEEWALLQRERLRQQMLEALADLAEFQELRGTPEAALLYARRQLQLDPWREEAHRQVMRLLALSGQRSAALAQYEACRRILAKEFGAEPADETTSLYERLRSGEALTPPPIPPNNLPLPPTPLVGREEETARLVDLLENPSCRMVTLVGPGGIGKTRLALHAATELLTAFAEGVCFIPLAPLSSPDLLLPTIASALDCIGSSSEDLKAQLLDHLRGREMLLLLDGFEHLLQSADLLAEIIQSAPRVSFLVTSQERLSLQAEWTFVVQGLSYPRTEPVADLEAYSAVALFLQRAKMARSDFVISQSELPPIARICQMVEGMPLGIELAAAGVNTLTCKEVARELEHSLDLLAVSLRDVPERHRSMRAAFEYSWNRLSEEEQSVFRTLSVFRGGFEIEAAQEVAGAAPPVLAALVNKSLVRMSPSGRYDLHELLRQFAQTRLEESGKLEGIKTRHLQWSLALAEAAEPNLTGAQQLAWLERLELENDNLRAAIRRALDGEECEEAIRLTGALSRFWYIRGYLTEGRRWIELALGKGDSCPAEQRAKALIGAGRLAEDQGDTSQAWLFYQESLELYREFEDPSGIANALNNLGALAAHKGDFEQARLFHEESLALRRKSKDLWGTSTSLTNLGFVAANLGRPELAQKYYEESLAIDLKLGDLHGAAVSLNNLGATAFDRGDCIQALKFYEQSLALRRQLNDKVGIARSLNHIGAAAFRQGDYTRCRQCLLEGLALQRTLGDKKGTADCLELLAWSEAIQGLASRAARLFGAAEALREQIGIPLQPIERDDYERAVGAARTQLDEAAFSAAWAEGRALALEQAIEYALLRAETRPPG